MSIKKDSRLEGYPVLLAKNFEVIMKTESWIRFCVKKLDIKIEYIGSILNLGILEAIIIIQLFLKLKITMLTSWKCTKEKRHSSEL